MTLRVMNGRLCCFVDFVSWEILQVLAKLQSKWREWCDVEIVDELVLMWNEAQCRSPKKETVPVVAKHQTGMTRAHQVLAELLSKWREWCDVDIVVECVVLMWNEAQCRNPKKVMMVPVVVKHQIGMTRLIEIVDVVMMMNMIQSRPTPRDQRFRPTTHDQKFRPTPHDHVLQVALEMI